jgi:predicted metal-dependent enzyme (double-stranded beta helix superfamily)
VKTSEIRNIDVADSIERIKKIIDEDGVSRDSLGRVQGELAALAEKSEFWFVPEFLEPRSPALTTFYLIHKDPASGIALYLNIMSPGEKTPIHNHTTWACIASVDGIETNYLFKRVDDASVPGYAEVIETGERQVAPGAGIGILPNDIHAVSNLGDTVVRHLHLYGRDVELLTERLMFDLEKKSCTRMPLITVDDWLDL